MNPDKQKKILQDFYIKRGYDRCLVCNRKLSAPNSMMVRHGPVCLAKKAQNIVNENIKLFN